MMGKKKQTMSYNTERGHTARNNIVDQLKRPGLHERYPTSKSFSFSNEKYENEYQNRNTEKYGSQNRTKNGNEEIDQYDFLSTKKRFLRHRQMVIGTLVVIILCVAIELLFPPLAAEERGYHKMNTSLTQLRQEFPNQTEHFWHVFSSAVKPISLQKVPKHPAIILLAGLKETNATSDRLAMRLSDVVKVGFDSETTVVFNCSQDKEWSADDAEFGADKSRASETHVKVGIVMAVESHPSNSLMIFEQLRNNSYAKKVIIMTLNMEKEAKSETNDEILDELKRLWKPLLKTEQMEPLFSQIRNSAVFVRNEKDCQKN